MGIHDLWIIMLNGVYDVIGKIEYYGFSWHAYALIAFSLSLFFSLFVRKIFSNSHFDWSVFHREERVRMTGFLEVKTKSGDRVIREREYFYDKV